MRAVSFLLAIVIAFSFASIANSELIDNGDGTIYSTLTDMTWIQDPVQFGRMESWDDAKDFVDNLNFAGYSDWRLPEIWSIYTALYYESALGILYHDELGNDFRLSWSGEEFNPGPFHFFNYYEVAKEGDLVTIWHDGIITYWSATENPGDPQRAYGFGLDDGTVYSVPKEHEIFGIWAVRDESSPVPEPSSVWLLCSGLVGLVGFRKKLSKKP